MVDFHSILISTMPSRTTPLHGKSPICCATELLEIRMPPFDTLRPSYISRRGSVEKLSQTRRSPRCASHKSLALFSCPARSTFRCHYLGSFLSPISEADGHPSTWTPFRISQPGALFCRNESYSNSPCISPLASWQGSDRVSEQIMVQIRR